MFCRFLYKKCLTVVQSTKKSGESSLDPSGNTYRKWCKKYDEKMHGVKYVKKLLELMEWENVLLNSMQHIRHI